MSKSKGNVINPIEIINTYGADAMRLALASSATQSRQIDLDRRKFEEFRNFINKVWNGSRFVLMNLEGLKNFGSGLDTSLFTLEDRWLLSRLARVTQEIEAGLQGYHFDKVAQRAYAFFWDELCAYYIEMVKPVLFGKAGDTALKANKQKLLVVALTTAIRLIHPIAPFITEEIFHLLKGEIAPSETLDPYTSEALEALLSPSCTAAPFPKVIDPAVISDAVEEEFSLVQELLYALRNIRAEMQLSPSVPCDLIIATPEEEKLKGYEGMLTSLVRIGTISYGAKVEGFHSSALVGKHKLIIPLPKELIEKERMRLGKEKEKVEKQIASLSGRLENPQFTGKAPEKLIKDTRERLNQNQKKLEEILCQLKQ